MVLPNMDQCGGREGFSPPITEQELEEMTNQVSDVLAAFRSVCVSSKEPSDTRRKFERALKVCEDAFTKISTAYKQYTYGVSIIKEIDKMVNAQGSGGREIRSYASVAGGPQMERISLSRGPTIRVAKCVSLSVKPKDSELHRFDTAAATKQALLKALKPSSVNLKVAKLTTVAHDRSVRIRASDVDTGALLESESLRRAGLQVSINDKQNPRLLISGISTGLKAADIEEDIENDLRGHIEDASKARVKCIYMFPRKDDRLIRAVIEVTPEARRIILKRGVYIGWSACRAMDYVHVLQCFKCLQSGHIAKACKNQARCGHCAGEHETRDCLGRSTVPKCHNCISTGHGAESAHTAFDKKKCGYLIRRLDNKAANINYG